MYIYNEGKNKHGPKGKQIDKAQRKI
jgi:hypothetical protein